MTGADRPRLARHVRLTFDPTRQRHVLQQPEMVVLLNGSGAAILELCDGRRTVAEIVAGLGGRYQAVPELEVRQFLTRLVARRYLELADGEPADGEPANGKPANGERADGERAGGVLADG